MSNNDTEKIRLSPEEAIFVQKLLSRNNKLIRIAVRSVLGGFYKDLGEDCLGEISLLVIQKTKMLTTHENPDGWVIVASKKIAANLIRKEYTRLKNTKNEMPPDVPTDSDAVYQEALYNIWLANNGIEKLLCTLTPRERDVYDLLYINRLTAKQTSEALNISYSTVRTIESAIKSKLKEEIKKIL
ncbi:MAG: sigma-70 family RNA polymerase sigma factor [Clostridia bacterium]|nr:sigma-70 family RNA polymerase sigma factor [Clostridia bacterium]